MDKFTGKVTLKSGEVIVGKYFTAGSLVMTLGGLMILPSSDEPCESYTCHHIDKVLSIEKDKEDE